MALVHRFDDTTMCVKGATCVATSGTVTLDGVNYTGTCGDPPEGDATRYCSGDGYQYMTNVNPVVPKPKCDCEEKKNYLLWILILLVIYYFKFY